MKNPRPFHDPRRPVYHSRQDTPHGRELVLALYTKGCLYRKCSFCALPALSAGDAEVHGADIRAQVDYVIGECSLGERAEVKRVTVFNSGSVLDQRTLPTDVLWYIFARLEVFPALTEVSLDTRADFVEDWELDGLKTRLQGRKLTLAVGYETQDERIRNGVLVKGLSEDSFQKLCALLAAKGVGLKAYVMVKPDAAFSEREGIEEAVKTLSHIARTGRRLGLAVEAHLNPTYVARGSLLQKEFRDKDYTPPRLWSVVEIVSRLEGSGLPIQVGLHTEGLAVRGGTFRNCGRCDKAVQEALAVFSGTQDFEKLKGLSCPCRGMI